MAGNRIGKTESAGGYEVTLHLTGLYPDWWEGRRFEGPTDWWACGTTRETTRDIIIAKMLGPPDERGVGLIPGDRIQSIRPRSGIPNDVDQVAVRHVSGGTSRCGFKSYEQGRKAFEGTEKWNGGIWLDEEPPLDIYAECLIRTASTVPGQRGGSIICTFTPLEGMSETVLYFLPDGPEALGLA